MTGCRFIGAALAAGLVVGSATAATITPGFFRLSNHPDGSANPPPYGLRLDELVNVTGGHDIFTFNFDHPSSLMFLEYTGSSIIISGQAFGGRDNGSSYFNDQFLGLYTINFVYNVGVGTVPGDDDLWVVAPMASNFGSIVGPAGSGVASVLSDKAMDSYNFRFGDEDNDAGHRGFNGLSGWGWLMVDGRHVANMDWIFTAQRTIPAPGAAGLLALGALALGRRRR